MKKDLKLKYGVARLRSIMQHNLDGKLVFQSNDGIEAMQELERLGNQHEPDYTYILIINDNEPQVSIGQPLACRVLSIVG